MRLTNFFIPTQKETPSEAKLKSHILMLRAGMVHSEVAGIYSWLPLGFRVLKKIQKIIENEHLSENINQMLMPTIQSTEIWKKSNRYKSYGLEMLKILDRNNKELIYGPTNEELMTLIGSEAIKSYKNLPVKLFHIQTKFRDEIRPRHGVMRAREFIMKDAYSFDVDEVNARKTYKSFFNLYLNIFKKIGLDILPVKALSGEIGGDLSHEFHMICDSGESEIVFEDSILSNGKKKKDFDFFDENFSSTNDFFKKENINKLKVLKKKSIELGHIFLFGTKYSKSFKFNINLRDNLINPYMGSYGIGISRLPAAIIESNNDEKGIVWPKLISPFDLILLNLKYDDETCFIFCEKFYDYLKKKKINVLYDDTSERIGIKFNKADLIGVPFQIIVGREYKENKVIQLKNRKTGDIKSFNEDEIFKNFTTEMENG